MCSMHIISWHQITVPEKSADVFIFSPHGTDHSSFIRIILNNFWEKMDIFIVHVFSTVYFVYINIVLGKASNTLESSTPVS